MSVQIKAVAKNPPNQNEIQTEFNFAGISMAFQTHEKEYSMDHDMTIRSLPQ